MCIRMWRPVINSHVVPCVPETFTFFILHLFILCVYTHMLRHVGGGESTACGGCFSPSTMWVLRIQLQLSGLATSTVTKWTVSPPCYSKRFCFADCMYGPPYPDVCGEGPGVCGYVQVEYRWPRRPEQSIGSPGTTIIGGCEPTDTDTANWAWILCKTNM